MRLLQGLLYALLGALVAGLARTGSALRTALTGAIAVGLGVAYWSPRPLAFGLLALAATVLVVERRRPWWWLLPIVWIWVNTHGSFLLGLGWLVLVTIGRRLDGERRPDTLPWLGGFLAGLVLACLNPLGPRLLIFPAAVLTKSDSFRLVAEWRAPSFEGSKGIATLLCLVAVVVVAARSKLRWREVLPMAAFLLAGLASQRNLPAAAIVIAPILGRAMSTGDRPVEAPEEPRHRLVAGALLALAALFLGISATQPAFDLRGYPVRASRLYERPARIATTDVAAGYLILERRDVVLFDDRVDMYPVDVTQDYVRLLQGRPGALELLDDHDVDVVVWPEDRALAVELGAAEDRWRPLGERDGWTVWERVSPR